MEIRAEKLLWPAVIAALAVKISLAAAIPITSDEAYFALWGRFVGLGYYDHPPMIGWLLYLVSFIGNSPVLIRLPAVLSTLCIALGIYSLLRPLDRNKAGLISLFFLVSPLNLLNVIIATDTPFMVFAFLSAYFLFRAEKEAGDRWYLFSGLALGAAFLSKYFAVFLGLAYVVYFFALPKDAKRRRGFTVLFLALVPFAALNIYWNYTHCWTNIMFNLVNRNKSERYSLGKILLFGLFQAYLFTPAVVYYLTRRPSRLVARLSDAGSRVFGAGYAVFAFLFTVPLLLFALLSVKKYVGLHWVLGFYPFLYLLLFFVLTEEELVKTVKFTAVFTLAHLLIVGAALSVPLTYLQGNKKYASLLMVIRPGEFGKLLDAHEGACVPATTSYAASAIFTYHFDKYFLVFGGGSHHGRQDDFQTDFRKHDGQDICIIRNTEPKPGEYSTFFQDVTTERMMVDTAQFYLVSGHKFKYANYRDAVLAEIRRKYYALPAWLPVSPNCDGIERYFRSPAGSS